MMAVMTMVPVMSVVAVAETERKTEASAIVARVRPVGGRGVVARGGIHGWRAIRVRRVVRGAARRVVPRAARRIAAVIRSSAPAAAGLGRLDARQTQGQSGDTHHD